MEQGDTSLGDSISVLVIFLSLSGRSKRKCIGGPGTKGRAKPEVELCSEPGIKQLAGRPGDVCHGDPEERAWQLKLRLFSFTKPALKTAVLTTVAHSAL